MKTFAGCSFLPAMAALIGSANFVMAQHTGKGMDMASNTLLVAELDAQQVMGGSSSHATGTGAFLLDPVRHALTYSLTYQGLEAGAPKIIALHNFGKGKNGEVVKTLCSAGTQACPSSASATITGRLESGDGRALDNHLIGEFDSERVYVEVVGGNGKPEIRGQLAPNGAMVMIANYVAHLAAVPGSGSKGTGTAVVSETYLPGGKVSVFYAATVAGTSGAPARAGIVAGESANAIRFTPQMAMPRLQLLLSDDKASGGSLRGTYEVDSAKPDALFAKRLLSAGSGEVQFVVTTSGFPAGELYGTLVPVH